MTSPQLLRESTPTARKSHHCSLCTGPIHPGQTYFRDTLVYDGSVYDWLTCPACDADDIHMLVLDWAGGYLDEGVSVEVAYEWATETVIHGTPGAHRAAREYLERAANRRTPHTQPREGHP